MQTIETIAQLEALYGSPLETALVKEVPYVSAEYRRFIEVSPFVSLATCGPEGLDCSPRGDLPGFVRVHDERTLLLPDRRGNNRVDSLRNIVRDARVALLFMVPGVVNTLRVNGRAVLSAEPQLLESFSVEGKPPRSVIIVRVDAAYFQCGRALVRSQLWDPQRHVDPASLPTPGEMLASISEGRLGGEGYDRGWLDRALATLW